MPDIKGNNKQIFDYLSSQGATGIGENADQFQKYMEKDDNRRQIYDYLSSVNAQGIGNSYDEFTAFVYGGDQQAAPAQAPAAPQEQTQQAGQTAFAPAATQNKQAAEGRAMFDEMRMKKGLKTAAEQAAELPVATEQQEAVQNAPTSSISEHLEQKRRDELVSLNAELEKYKETGDLVDEYERRLDSIKHSLDPQSEKTKEDTKWLQEHKEAYRTTKGSKDMKEYNRIKRRIYDLTVVPALDDVNEQSDAINKEIWDLETGPMDSEKTARISELQDAKEIYQMAWQELSHGSKYDEGYEDGNSFKTAIKQFFGSTGRQVDRGTFTLGASEGAATQRARAVGDKYNTAINSAKENLGYSDEDVDALFKSLNDDGNALEEVVAELDSQKSALDAMEATYRDMEKNGASESELDAYAKKYNKKIQEYNQTISDKYQPLESKYEEERGNYDKLMSAIDESVATSLTDGEREILKAFESLINARAVTEEFASTASKSGASFENTLEFMVDFWLTKGLDKAGTKAATKIAKNRAVKKLGAEAVKNMTVRPGIGLNMAKDLGVSVARTAALPTRFAQSLGEQLTQIDNTPYNGKDALGRYQFSRSHENAWANTGVENFIEYWSEGFGEYFGAAEKALFKSTMGSAPKTLIGDTLKKYKGSVGRYLENTKFNGQLNETLEEVVGSGLNALFGFLSNDRVGDKGALEEFAKKENLLTLTVSFLPLSAISSATNLSAYHQMKSRYNEAVEGLNPFIESGAISRGQLDKLADNLSDMTPEQVEEQIVKIADQAREFNEGHLPSDFVKNIMGYLEGTYSMNLRSDDWEDSQEKLSVVNSYSTMYANPQPGFAWDADQQEAEARQNAIDAGFTEEELEQGSYILAQEAREMSDTEPERADALLDYANAKAAVEGLENGYRKQGEQIAQANEEEIRSNLDVNGNVVTAVVNEYGAPKVAYITSDDVTIAPDGTVTTPTGNGVVKYRTYENGEYGPESTIMSDKVSEAQAVPTDQYIQMENDAILNGRNELYEQAKRTVSPTGQSRAISQRIGMNVVIRGNGAYQPVRVERMTDDGMKVVISGDKDTLKGVATAAQVQTPGGKYLEIDVTRLWPLLDKEADGVTLTTFEPEARTEAGAEQEQPQQAPAQATQVNPDELEDSERTIMFNGRPTKVTVNSVGGDGVWFTYMDETGTEREGDMPLEDFMNSIVADEAPAAVEEAAEAPAPAQEQAFPVDEKGNRVYDHPSVSPERAYRELMTGVEPGSKNEANRVKYIASKANKAAQAVAEAENKIAGIQAKRDAVDEWEIGEDEELDAFESRKDAKKAEYDAEIAKVQDQMAELKRKAAHWAAVRDMAKAVAYMRKDARLVARAEAWTQRTGIKVKICRTPEEVDDKSVKKELAKGERVGGWYNTKTGEVGLYLPNLANEAEVDKTFIHEVVSHKGLKEVLGGQANYDALCDKVWDQLMSEEDRKKYLAYNSHLKGSEEFLRRAAADEWIAHFSETLGLESNRNLFDKFVDFVKEFLDRILGEDAKISKDDIATLLRSSLARYESERKSTAKAKPLSTESLSPDVQAELREKGEVMDGGVVMDDLQDKLKKETGYKTPNELDMDSNPIVGDVRLSKTTIPAWATNYMTYPEAKEHVVKVLENLTERMAADELVNGVIPGGVYKYGEKASGGFAGPLRTNIEYVVTFDMDTSCPRSLQYLEYVKMIEAQIGRPMTQREMIQLTEMMRIYGQMIPCVYCYCENKRQALKQYYTNYIASRRAVINAKTDDEALEKMYGHETTKAAQESKDPEVVLTDAAYKVFKRWRNGKQTYNPSIKQLWSQYHQDRNVILTVLDGMLDGGRITTMLTDETIKNNLCKELGINDVNAKGAVLDIVSEWKWNRIEDRPHDDFQRVDEEDDLVVGEDTLSLWREMTLYGKSASQAKNVMRYVPYTDELKTLSQEQRDYINGMGGLRMHSSNDFRIDYVLDYFQFMADMEVNHMFGHTYTKSPEFVRIFGNSGYKINMSIAAYEDSRGVRPNPDEGFDWATARELREKFPNAGIMLMATSDAQVQLALDSDWIDMFIPFHASGLPKAVWYDMRHWSDYSSIQNERFLNGDEMRQALEADGVEVPKKIDSDELEKMYTDHFNITVVRYQTGKKKGKRISPHFLPGPTVVDGVNIPGHNNDYNRYIELCRQYGVHPRFYGMKVKDNTPEGGGRIVDISEHPAYMKCIKETARTDTPQTAIQFNFDQPSEALGGMTPIDYAMRELEARAASESQMAGSPVRNIYESYKQDPYGIVQQFISGVINHEEAYRKAHNGEELPLDYLTPDSRKWFMTERKALEEAYKDVDTIPYHPHEYDADGNLIMEPDVQEAGEDVADDGSWTSFRKLEDPAKIEELENGEWEEDAYRAVQFIPDPNGEWEYDLGDGNGVQKGNVYPPMSAQTEKGEWRNPIQKGVIEESEEAPDKAFLKNGKWVFRLHKGNGKYVDAAYNPYIHSSDTMLNDQFSEAQSRGNLVVMRVAVPKSELDGENLYQAEKAKDHVGRHDWKAGPIQGELTGTRTVYLSRYDKPMELMPIEKVGESVAKMLEGQVETMPTNVVWPQLRAELEKRGVNFVETDNKGKLVSGENAGKTWKQVYGKKKPAKKQKNSDTGTRFRKATNGKESNLTDEQWEMVRTPEFKAWFGDWENDPANASKVVDENGEPLVVYRVERWEGDTADYTVFDENKGGNWRGFYFTNRDAALKNYGDESTLRAFFLDSKNPFTENNFNILQGDKQELIDMGHDGMIFAPDGIDARNFEVKVFDPAQIKSATNNNGEFRTDNPDIRFRITPEQDREYMDAVNAGDMEKAEQMVRDAFKAAFPNTKVVDVNGEPMVVYHGTHTYGFTEFAQPGEDLQGLIWLTDQKRYAEVYADYGYEDDTQGVYSLFADIKNPLDLGYIEDVVGSDAWNGIADKLGMTPKELYDRLNPFENTPYQDAVEHMSYIYDYTREAEFANLLKEKGYDGAFALEEGVNKTPTYAAVNPGQVKSADPVTYDDAGNVIPLSERFNPENNDIRFRVSDEVDVPSVSANLYDAYENQNGEDKPWMSEQELIDRIEAELPYGIDTKELFSKIDEYRRLDEEDFDEGRRDFSGSERDAVFQEILSGLNGLAENGRAETSKEDLEKAERIAAGERIVTEKVIDSMPEAIGAGVQRVSRNDMPAGHRTDKGYYDPATNTVSVCMDNVLDERDAVATVIHETVGRKGLREIFGDQYRESMASSYAALDAEGRAWVNGYMLRNGLQPGDEGILRGMQEYMAVQAERGEGSFLDAVNDILSQAVDFSVGTEGFRFTNRELAYILRASFEHAKNPGWLDTPAGKAQDTLWKREYGINESDPNRPTDPEGPDAGTRFRRGDTGNALRDYERDMKDWRTAAVMENQNADLPVKIGYEKALKEKYGDQWSDRMKNLPENEDYLMRHNLSSSRAETESHNFMLFHFNPMLEKLREVQSKLVGRLSSADERQDAYERILDYLYAVSGLERNEWERNNGGEAKDWSGITSLMGRPKEEWSEAEADARAMVDAFKAEVGDDALLDQLWDAVRSCTDYSLDHAYRYGLLAKDEYERLRGTDTKPRMWNYYLPLRGFVERTAEEEYNYAGLVSTDKGNNEVVKDAKGRWTEADNPLANILNIALKEIVQGNENYARQALYRFATNLGENSLLSVRKPWYVKDAATGKWSLAEPEEGQDIEAFEAEMKAKKERKEARQGRKGLDLGLIMASKGHRNQHLIHVKVGGEDRMIWVNGNPALARAVSGIGKEPNYRLFRAGSRVISNLFTTYSIDFTAKNLLRDSIYSRVALLVKEDQHYRWTFMKNWWQNFGFGAFAFPMVRLAAMWDSGALQRKPADKRSKREQMFIDFMTDGGQTGYTVIKSVEKIKSDIERTMRRAGKKTGPVVVPILGWYGLGVRTLNEAFELLTRFTAYQTSRDMGRTGQRAAYDAKEISVNFNRKGAQSNEGFWGQVAAYFGGTHYFYNAGIQGFDNFLRLFTKPRKGKGWIMPVTSAGIMTLGFFTPMINALLSGGGDDDDDNREAEWYWNLPEWVRRNNIVIGFKNKYLAVPLPVEFRALYGLGDLTASVFAANKYAHPTPGRVMLDAVALASSVLPVNPIEGVNGSIASASELAESAVRTAVPDLTMFFVDWVTNKDYTGRALVNKSPYNPAQPASQGAFASTPKALVEACQWIGEKTGVDVAPGLVRDFLNNYGGGYYRFAEDLSKQIFTDDTHPRRWDDVPFLSGFTGHIDEDRTITYSNTVLNTYKDLATNIVKKMNLYSNSADITEKIAFETPEALPAKAKVQAILSGKDYELAKMYYFGMKDEDTGQTEKVVKVHQKGKSAGKQYKATVKIKIPGVSSRKKAWRDLRDYWASLPDNTAEEKAAKAQAYADMTNAWHEYYNAAADLADKLMDYDYGKTE